MREKIPRSAGLISVVVGVVALIFVYAILGTVDIVYRNDDGNQLGRQENVSVFADIDLPEGEYTYLSGEETKSADDLNGLRFEIAKTLVTNLFSFDWQEMDNEIILTQK